MGKGVESKEAKQMLEQQSSSDSNRDSENGGQPGDRAHSSSRKCAIWKRPAFLWTIIVALVVIIVALAAVLGVSQTGGPLNSLENRTKEQIIRGSKSSRDPTDLHSRLKQFMCESSPNKPAEGPGCKLCPPDWLLHRDQCYWVSKNKSLWNKSRNDCSRRDSRLLAIRDQAEMAFIQTITKDTPQMWLDLTFTSSSVHLVWMDGSVVNRTLFKAVHLPKENNNCGVLKADEISFENCSAVSKWICVKESFPI
uniref:Killer cell lectin-like receptor subfamily B member 1B allele B n=1 Tax=Pelodiscus sinensis TaxID=13735 RepID=K7F441_PELSI|nr:killer cell lectin-like receptor subfamily B member 1B allele B [Pelodiscus sinensis]|eukprot:XP_006119705.1 killer cell lectin-like receptor subfamily B member 1B allele B [Pelodiscus sinensis]